MRGKGWAALGSWGHLESVRLYPLCPAGICMSASVSGCLRVSACVCVSACLCMCVEHCVCVQESLLLTITLEETSESFIHPLACLFIDFINNIDPFSWTSAKALRTELNTSLTSPELTVLLSGSLLSAQRHSSCCGGERKAPSYLRAGFGFRGFSSGAWTPTPRALGALMQAGNSPTE